jgi:hypothetical protein
MDTELREYLSYSIVLPVIIGFIRVRNIDRTYLPFVFVLIAGLVNEVISTILINRGYYNNINTNIYYLIECFFVLQLFRNWNLFGKNGTYFWFVLGGYFLLWCIDWIFISPYFVSYFIIIYSFSVVLFSVRIINKAFDESRLLWIKNAQFLICLGFIMYFTVKMLIEIFMIYGSEASEEFSSKVYDIMAFINLAANLLFILAVLWIPRKQEYTSQ